MSDETLSLPGLRNRLDKDDACLECGFLLWEPIAVSAHSRLGLYNDDRFPGRCILALHGHYASLDALPPEVLIGFMSDVQTAIRAIQIATGAARVNTAILGNRDPHVHAHLIPRYPEHEEFPDCSPWNDPRKKGKLGGLRARSIKERILACLIYGETPQQ